MAQEKPGFSNFQIRYVVLFKLTLDLFWNLFGAFFKNLSVKEKSNQYLHISFVSSSNVKKLADPDVGEL